MFERKVASGDFIIRQGDDGDNFYVVERYLHLKQFSNGGIQTIEDFAYIVIHL